MQRKSNRNEYTVSFFFLIKSFIIIFPYNWYAVKAATARERTLYYYNPRNGNLQSLGLYYYY